MDMERYVYGTENWLLVFSWVNHSKSAKIGTHSDFSNDPKGPWSCNTANMDLLVKHVTTHLTKCCQESFNYLNSSKHINCPPMGFPNPLEDQSLSWNPVTGWSISARLHWAYSILRYKKIQSDTIRPQGTFEPNSDWLPKNLAAVITQLFAWIGIQCHRTACKFLRHDVISPNIPQPFWMQLAAKTSPSSNLLVSFVLLVSGASSY